MPEAQEVSLVERCQRGDEEAFRELMDRYQRRTYWIAYNMLNNYDHARDISQEAFLRVFRNIANFDVKKNFYTWLYQIVVNLCIDQLRRKSHGKSVGIEDIPPPADDKEGPEQHTGRGETRGRVHKALNRLPPKYKAVLTLRDIQGFSCGEIADIVGCSNATVRWRLHRARKLFRAIWDGRAVEAREDEDSSDP